MESTSIQSGLLRPGLRSNTSQSDLLKADASSPSSTQPQQQQQQPAASQELHPDELSLAGLTITVPPITVPAVSAPGSLASPELMLTPASPIRVELTRDGSWSSVDSTSSLYDPRNQHVLKRCATIETDKIEFKSTEDTEQINQYKLFQLIGKGMYGSVRLCQNETDNQLYAVKCLSKKRLRRRGCFGRSKKPTSDGLQDLRREIAILKKLVHPNIVRLYEVMDDPEHDIVYMVMELLKLGPVMDMSRPETVRTFTERQACTYFRQLLMAVEFLHFNRVIHRDIKPSNLLLYTNDVIKLSDFGVSHICERDGELLVKTAGTPAFMAPEGISVEGKEFRGEPVDIWAAGVTLYTFIYGKLPFAGGNVMKLYSSIREDPVPFNHPREPPPSTALLDVLSSLLDKDPSRRATVSSLRRHEWVTRYGADPLISPQTNCHMVVEVTEEELAASMTNVCRPSLGTLAIVHSMVKKRSFRNPFAGSAAAGGRPKSASVNNADRLAPDAAALVRPRSTHVKSGSRDALLQSSPQRSRAGAVSASSKEGQLRATRVRPSQEELDTAITKVAVMRHGARSARLNTDPGQTSKAMADVIRRRSSRDVLTSSMDSDSDGSVLAISTDHFNRHKSEPLPASPSLLSQSALPVDVVAPTIRQDSDVSVTSVTSCEELSPASQQAATKAMRWSQRLMAANRRPMPPRAASPLRWGTSRLPSAHSLLSSRQSSAHNSREGSCDELSGSLRSSSPMLRAASMDESELLLKKAQAQSQRKLSAPLPVSSSMLAGSDLLALRRATLEACYEASDADIGSSSDSSCPTSSRNSLAQLSGLQQQDRASMSASPRRYSNTKLPPLPSAVAHLVGAGADSLAGSAPGTPTGRRSRSSISGQGAAAEARRSSASAAAGGAALAARRASAAARRLAVQRAARKSSGSLV